MKITSSAFRDSEQIPTRYTCDGGNINPPLEITDVPTGTVSLALIFEDLDA
ncbi:MAG: YbhB/YbcL family Raf kinase inhibitor-like protein, partial [Minisyncoccota bacterium]